MNYAYQDKHPPKRLAAMVAQFSDMIDQWITDTDATHHMTSDLSNLSLKSEHPGMDAVVVGNGMKLSISFIGSSSIHTPHSSFLLKHILHVPSLKHNLLSVQQFARDKKVSLTFDANHFLIKENLPGQALYKGMSNNGLYTLPRHLSLTSPPPKDHFTTAISLTSSWHCRLGHPSSVTLQTLLSQLSPFSISRTNP